MGCIYIGQNIRPRLDKEIEALAQAIVKQVRADVVDQDVYAMLPYAVAKLMARVTSARFKGHPTTGQLLGVSGSVRDAHDEFLRRVVQPALEKDKAANGDVFGEVL